MLAQLRELLLYFPRLMHDATSLGPNHLLAQEPILVEVRFAALVLARGEQKLVLQVLALVQAVVLLQREVALVLPVQRVLD